MSFDVAIENVICSDGKKAVDSVKAAYLYADKVRVYDYFTTGYYFTPDNILRILSEKDPTNKEQYEKNEWIKHFLDIFTKYGPNLIYNLSDDFMYDYCDFIDSNELTDNEVSLVIKIVKMISSDSDINIVDKHTHLSEIVNRRREKSFEKYNREIYLRDLTRMGVEFIYPQISTDPRITRRQIESFYNRLTNDSGFKLINGDLGNLDNNASIVTRNFPSYLSEYAITTLPSFEEATIDEIIDIKKELEKYIIPYRIAIIEMAQQVREIPDSESLQQECKRLYDSLIDGKVQDIKEAIRDNNVFKNIASSAATSGTLWTGISSLSLAVATNTEIDKTMASAAISLAGYSIVNGLKTTWNNDKKIKHYEMYFLYETGKKLRDLKINRDLGFVNGSRLEH